MEKILPGDELSHLWLKEAITLPPALLEKHLSSKRHGVRMFAHEKGALVEYLGQTFLVFDGACVAAQKAPSEAVVLPTAIEPIGPGAAVKRGPGRPPKALNGNEVA